MGSDEECVATGWWCGLSELLWRDFASELWVASGGVVQSGFLLGLTAGSEPSQVTNVPSFRPLQVGLTQVSPRYALIGRWSDYPQRTLILRIEQTISDHNQINLARFFRKLSDQSSRFMIVSPTKKTTYEFLVSGLIVEAAGIEPAS